MKIAAGTKLGPYEIEHAIGAGGMGVVYRADDSRLGRKVAIKVLPHARGEHFRRFEREARTIGSLNHPNLLTLHDVGEYDGVPFLVTEMLDGESLRARLSRGPLRLREAIQIGADVARGLAAAHDAGIVHRDVKPDNIFLTTEGRTKILDFGIAKLRRSSVEMPAVDIAHVPTMTPTTADTGMVIGTPGYMAPEQLDGGTVDARTDIFALGVVLYEMIAGKRAFASDSAVEESYAILKTPAEPPKGATKALARVVLRCLEKRPDTRFQSAIDLAFALDELDASTDPVARISKVSIEPEPRASARTIRDAEPRFPERVWPVRWLAIAAVVGIAGATAGLLIGRRTAATPPAPARVASWPSGVEGGPVYRRVTYHTQPRWSARLAPDGASVLYSTSRDGREQVVRSLLAQPSILPLHVDGRLLDVSPRGELLVLVDEGTAGGTLARALEGAGPRAIADRVTSATWMPDPAGPAIVRGGDTIEFPIGTVIATRSAGKLDLLRASPTGDRLAFVDHPASADTRGRVIVIDPTGKQLAVSTDQTGIEGIAWSADGTEVWFSNASEILALDRAGRERVVLRGAARLVLADVRPDRILVAPSDVRLKMFTGPRGGPFREVGLFDASDVAGSSTDGSVIAFVEATGTGQTADGYAQFLRRGDAPPTLITNAYRLALLPDASAAIVIAGTNRLSKIPTGVGTSTALPLGAIASLDIGEPISVAWSGRYIVLTGAEAGGAMKLWRIDLEQPTPLPLPIERVGGSHAISPDGQLVAVAAPAGGISLVPAVGGTPRLIAGPAGEQPLSFTGDGTALFVRRLVGDTIEVTRIELATGARSEWTRIKPEQQPVYYSVVLDASGEHITYSTNSDASDLYVLEPPAQ